MNKYRLFLTSIFLFLFLVILPIKVEALSYKSDFVDLKSDVVFQTDEFELDLKYIEFANEIIDKPAAITGEGRRKISNIYYYHYVVYYYNDQKEEIGATDGYNGIWNMISDSAGSYLSSFLESKDMKLPYKLSDIKYYKLFIEPSTKEMVDNYNYENYKKINMNGLDPITDFNTIEMKIGEKIITSNESNNDNINNYINTYGNGEYALTKYKIDIKVNENNTFNITEFITAYFNVEKHGIFRKIPLRNKVVRLDGTKSNNRAKISDIRVNEQSITYNELGYQVIKIGDPNSISIGSKDYVINYLYNIGKDTGKGYDEFYFNLIGYEWDTTISNVEFTITMPKEFDKTKLGFSSGVVGSLNTNNIEYNVDGNVIKGRYNGVLDVGESLTVRLELPEGYFVGSSDNFALMIIILFVLPIAFAIISFLLWVKYGKDDKVIETVEFYPPEGFNSAEVGFLYKGQVDEKDVVSLLIYLANKGYIRIEESEEKSLFSTKKGFKIIKMKEYDGNNINEKVFLKGLFNTKRSSITSAIKLMKDMKNSKQEVTDENNSQSKLEEVTAIDLYDSFYVILKVIVENLNDKENKDKIFEKSTSGKSIAVILMIIISVFIIIGIPTLEYSGVGELGMTLFITLFYIPFYAVIFIKKMPLIIRLLWGGFTIFHSIMFFSVFPIREALFDNSILLLGFLVGLVCIIFMIICFKAMPKRTPYGNEILGKIKGFRNFLETAEKPKLEELVMQNPLYFYNILPFTYVLGVSDKWIKKFETISLQEPDWYGGSAAFSMASFGSFMDSTMSSASSAMSSSSSSSSSGGGSSGGGSGGGGGGSW
ncbi:MAG: DUF2207 domain-containing protein [Bacilli bacterium]|jgi:uncharacterized membrane protein